MRPPRPGGRPSGVIEGDGTGRWGRIPALTEAGLRHGFSCRELPAPAATLAERLGIPDWPRAGLRQLHGAQVRRAEAGAPDAPPEGDALVARGPGIALMISTADCIPVLLLDPLAGAVGAVHAGWRGTVAGVVEAAIRTMVEELGAAPARLHAGIGPFIGPCCFEVGDEVAGSFTERFASASGWLHPGPRGRPHLDLGAANRHQMIGAGLHPERIAETGWCTRCRADLFPSYRRDGAGAGRILTLAALAGGGAAATPYRRPDDPD